jgi:AcrR family transcriptional regulator
MKTPDRLLRADAEDLERDPPELTPRELEQYTRILTLSEGIMARKGVHTMTLSGLAHALKMGSATLRRHFSDLDVLLATLISRHLRNLVQAIGKVPHDAPERPQKMRAAYLAHTRTDRGTYTDAHLLLVRYRHLLPDDLLTPIECCRRDIGDRLAHGFSEDVLDLLDLRTLDAARIEATLATIIATAPQRPNAASKSTTPIRRDRLLTGIPPAVRRDPFGLDRFGPVPMLATLGQMPQVHSSA